MPTFRGWVCLAEFAVDPVGLEVTPLQLEVASLVEARHGLQHAVCGEVRGEVGDSTGPRLTTRDPDTQLDAKLSSPRRPLKPRPCQQGGTPWNHTRLRIRTCLGIGEWPCGARQ